MLDWVLNTALFLQTLFQPLVSLKCFTSFKVAFRAQIWKKYYNWKMKGKVTQDLYLILILEFVTRDFYLK